MTSLTFYPSNNNVLGVIKISEVWKVVDSYPFNRTGVSSVSPRLFIPIYRTVQFGNFRRSFSIIMIRRSHCVVTVHTNVCRRDRGVLRFISSTVAILTLNLVNTGVNLVRKLDRLHRLITFMYSDIPHRLPASNP